MKNNITKTIMGRNRDFKELWYSRIEPTMLGSVSGKKIWDTDPDDEDSYMYVGETLEHYLLQSHIKVIDAVIENLKKAKQDPYAIREKIFKEDKYWDEEKRWDKATDIGALSFPYNYALDDQISSLEEVKRELLNN